MRRHINSARNLLLPIIDFFYPPFRKALSIQTFRYAAAGGINMVLGLVLYYVSYKFILQEKDLYFRFFAFKSHVAALFIAFCFGFPFGFFLMKYLVFTDSKVRGRVQVVRYFIVYLFNLVLNYLLLKVLVEILYVYAVFAQILTTVVVVAISYLAQRHFTFKIRDAEKDLID